MKTYAIKDKKGFQLGFEIDNIYIGIDKIVELLSTVNNVSNIRKRRLFDLRNEFHIEFDYAGIQFVVWEPYGDSSRYWICPMNMQNKADMSDIENAFKEYKSPILIKLFGDIVSLKFIEEIRKIINRGKNE